jgi:type I restriction enzyme R subunit
MQNGKLKIENDEGNNSQFSTVNYRLRRPRILFLADRNILADQADNAFSAFPEDAMVRIKPKEIKQKGKVPTNGSIFFTIFQSFMFESIDNGKLEINNAENNADYLMVAESQTEYETSKYNFGEYPKDYFDFIIIDECHRGGANDEGNWRGILEYFSPAVQLGLTATPKRKDNVDTYKYFGESVYIYSLKEGINDGFLTPFKVKRIKTTLDDYIYISDDDIIEGEIEEGKLYEEPDFNQIIEIKAREAKRVQIYMDEANENEKTIIFCATQIHATAVRDLVNQNKKSKDPNYCVRVTANDGERGEQFLREFQDNEKTIPTILTTSHTLSTGVDAR